MKKLLTFTFLQLLIPTVIFGLFLLVLIISPVIPSSDKESVYVVIFMTLGSGLFCGVIPCIAFGALTQRTFPNFNFQVKSLLYWFLSFLFTMLIWFPGGGGGEEGKLYLIVGYASIAAICWILLSKKYLSNL
jgi:hypothetical protein